MTHGLTMPLFVYAQHVLLCAALKMKREGAYLSMCVHLCDEKVAPLFFNLLHASIHSIRDGTFVSHGRVYVVVKRTGCTIHLYHLI